MQPQLLFFYLRPAGAQIKYPECGRGIGHVTPTIFGSTFGYPSDSLASCSIFAHVWPQPSRQQIRHVMEMSRSRLFLQCLPPLVKRLCSSLGLIARRYFVHYLWISCTLLSAANAAPSVIIFLFVPTYGLNHHDSKYDK